MSEKFSASSAGVASGTTKALINVYSGAATPTGRPMIYDLMVGSVATPADQAAAFSVCRTTGIGTPAGTYTPNNLDPAGPAGQCVAGVGAYSAEPTKTANKELLRWSLNQRATFRWVAQPGSELILPATQNNGACLQTVSSTGTQVYESTVLFQE